MNKISYDTFIEFIENVSLKNSIDATKGVKYPIASGFKALEQNNV